MSWTLLAIAVASAGGATGGLSAPRVLTRLRQPGGPAQVASPSPVPAEALPAGALAGDSVAQATPSLSNLAQAPHLAPLLAATGVALGAVVGWGVGWTPALAAWTYLTAVCLLLGYIDARTRLLPTQLIAPSYAVVVVLLVVAGIAEGSTEGLVRAGLGWGVMGGLYLLLWLIAPRSLGYGDVRLSGLLALCLGYQSWSVLVTGLYAGFLLGGLASLLLVLARRASRGTHFPFGPFMMLGALAAVVCGPTLTHWYVAR